MSRSDSAGDVACTMTDEEESERVTRVRSNLVPYYDGYEESEEGLAVLFEGTDEALKAVAAFTADELVCCSFAEYEITVSPPYEQTVLTVSGPDGTREMFYDGFVSRLEEWSA